MGVAVWPFQLLRGRGLFTAKDAEGPLRRWLRTIASRRKSRAIRAATRRPIRVPGVAAEMARNISRGWMPMHADAGCWLKDRGLFAGPRRGPDEYDAVAGQQASRRPANDDTVELNSDRLLSPDRSCPVQGPRCFLGTYSGKPAPSPFISRHTQPTTSPERRSTPPHRPRASAAKIPYLRQLTTSRPSNEKTFGPREWFAHRQRRPLETIG